MTSALRNRNYVLYLAGNTVSLHGLWVYRVALGWHAWELTESEFWVGVIAFTQFFPIVLFGSLFGVLTDRIDRRSFAIGINCVSTLIMLTLAGMTSLGEVGIYLLSAFSLLQGINDSANTPVRLALVTNLVPQEQLQSAMATNSVAFNLSRFIGPAIAGVIIAKYGVAVAYAFNGISYVAILAALFVIRTAPQKSATARSHVWEELKVGIRYVAGHRGVRQLLGLVALASFFGRGPLELLPAFAESVFNRGATGLAILTAAAGAGAVVAGILISRGHVNLRIRYIAIGIAIVAGLVILLGTARAFWLGVTIVTLLGFALTICGVGAQVLLQTLIDDEVRGRVSSLWGMIAFGGTAVGGLVVGALASQFGLSTTTLAIGIVCALLTLRIYLRRLAIARERASDQASSDHTGPFG